jgi:hypothetical protein
MHFKKTGWIYIPVSIWGWIVTVIYLAISIYTLISIGQNYNSLRNSLIRFFPYLISFSVVFFWIAGNTSDNDPGKK